MNCSVKGQAGLCPLGRSVCSLTWTFHKKVEMSYPRATPLLVTSAIWYTSWPELSHAIFGAQNQGFHLRRKNGTGNYSIIPATIRKEKNQERVHRSCSPSPGLRGPLWRTARLCLPGKQAERKHNISSRHKREVQHQAAAPCRQRATGFEPRLKGLCSLAGAQQHKRDGSFHGRAFSPLPLYWCLEPCRISFPLHGFKEAIWVNITSSSREQDAA